MKRLLLACVFVSSMAAAADVVQAPLKHLYVPEGFDSNDSVEVIVAGSFPTPCHSRNTVAVEINESLIKVDISAIEPDQKLNCPQMVVPFKEVVSLGNLQGGEYKIVVNDTLTDVLKVAEASSGAVDDFIYADVERLEKVGDQYIIHGWRYSHCIELDKIKVISNNKDTLSVLPVMKQVSDFCPMKMTPVVFPEVKLDLSSMKTKEPLIHIRTMDGKSFNKILSLE